MVASFKRTCACTVVFSAPDPIAGHCRPTPLPETPGHSQASLLWGLCLFLLAPGIHKVLSVPSKSLFPQSPVQIVKHFQMGSGVQIWMNYIPE